MGFFSKLKNSVTGGWADVSLSIDNGTRGEAMPVTVMVNVRGEDINFSRIYLQVRCREEVHIPGYTTIDRDDAGDRDTIDVNASHTLFEHEYSLTGANDLEANSSENYEVEIELPEHLPASMRGHFTRFVWQAYAGLDMRGNDPDSGWVEFQVE